MLEIDDGKKAVVYARQVIEEFVRNNRVIDTNLTEVFNEKQGAFVTIHTYPDHDLRGCIGIPMPVMPLKQAIAEGAKSATRDPRFPPLSEDELTNIIIEVTILTKPEKIEVSDPRKYLENIKIGRDGLIVEKDIFKGLLLPQVPVEQSWDKKEFISQTCMKAGLMPDAWFEKDTKISKFSGQIFSEIKPKGEIEEKKIDGSDN